MAGLRDLVRGLFATEESFSRQHVEHSDMPPFREVSFFQATKDDGEHTPSNFKLVSDSLFCYSLGNDIVLFDFVESVRRGVLRGHCLRVISLEPFNESILVSGACDKTVRIWNLQDFSCVHTLEFHDSPVKFVCVLDRRRILTCAGGEPSSVESHFAIWDVRKGRLLGKILRSDLDEKILSVHVLSPHKFLTCTPSMMHLYVARRSREGKNRFKCLAQEQLGTKLSRSVQWLKVIDRDPNYVAASANANANAGPSPSASASAENRVVVSSTAAAAEPPPPPPPPPPQTRFDSTSKLLVVVGMRNGRILLFTDTFDRLGEISHRRVGPVQFVLVYSPNILFCFHPRVLVVHDVERQCEIYRKKRMSQVQFAIILKGTVGTSARPPVVVSRTSAAASAAGLNSGIPRRRAKPIHDCLVTINDSFLLFWSVDPTTFRLSQLGRQKVTLHTRRIEELFKLTDHLFLTYSDDTYCVLWNDAQAVESVRNQYSIAYMCM